MRISKVQGDIKDVIVKSGDERILIDPATQLNKYHLNPAQSEGIFNRGSCTCNVLTEDALEGLKKIEVSIATKGFEAVREEQVERIKSLYIPDEKDKFEIFFAPSGSDLIYLPLMFAQLLAPSKKILNIMTCTEELGSGSAVAASGKYFMAKNQFEETLPIDEMISNQLDIDLLTLSARSEEGRIIDNTEEVKRLISQYESSYKIGNLVISSKSGIKDDLEVIHTLKEDIQWVVDLCQFRTDRETLNTLVEHNVMSMITGSKFFQAPPFCGALIVPKSLIEQLKAVTTEIDPAFKKIFAQSDIPVGLPNLRKQFAPLENLGVLYRWECAIVEMEKYYALPWETCDSVIQDWNDLVKGFIRNSDYFELMPDNHLTTRSIVSFRIKKNGEYLDFDQLKAFHKALLIKDYTPYKGYTKIAIGQPVKFGDQAFIRLALGAQNIRQILEMDDSFNEDKWLLNLLEQEIKEYAV